MSADNVTLSETKRRIAATYNLAAEGYDKPALRYFRLIAHLLVERAHLKAGAVVLDAATGTGEAALATAIKVGAHGQVIGVDIAGDMLAQAKQKAALHHLTNLSIQFGDIEHLDFASDRFDAVLCAAGIFFLPDILSGLQEWRRALKPGGTVAFSGFGEHTFQPMSDLFEARLRRYGVQLAAPQRSFPWQRLTDPEHYHDLMQNASFEQIEVSVEQLGYWLNTEEEWWDIVWNSGLRGPVSQLLSAQLKQFKQEHLAEVEALTTEQGIWLDVPAIFVLGIKPFGSLKN
jgi:ubiquinone/menaquinone biosynthesis C-methylase UbiE